MELSIIGDYVWIWYGKFLWASGERVFKTFSHYIIMSQKYFNQQGIIYRNYEKKANSYYLLIVALIPTNDRLTTMWSIECLAVYEHRIKLKLIKSAYAVGTYSYIKWTYVPMVWSHNKYYKTQMVQSVKTDQIDCKVINHNTVIPHWLGFFTLYGFTFDLNLPVRKQWCSLS